MTSLEIQSRLAQRPEMCQTWVEARSLSDGGVLYLSSISETEERIGVIHVYIWARQAKGKPEVARKAAYDLMQTNRLDRLVCEIDAQNRLAIKFALRGGFKLVGIMRRRKDGRGSEHNVVLLDALPEDLAWVKQQHQLFQ